MVERSATNNLSDPRYGAAFFVGIAKRGPMGVAIPVSSREEYERIFGDPRDSTWSLFRKGDHQMPDAIDGYFRTSGGSGTLWITRSELDGSARRASIELNSRLGHPVLRIEASNPGRWGGAQNNISKRTLISVTPTTFTIVAPGVKVNEFEDAFASFDDSPGKLYQIEANTAANERSGEVVFSIGAQYHLLNDGVIGPQVMTGTSSYERYPELSGTVEYSQLVDLIGTVDINEDALVGNGTAFTSELDTGDVVYFSGEPRTVMSITSDTTLTIDRSFSMGSVAGQTLQRDNQVLTGTTTLFTTELEVGRVVYAEVDGEQQARRIVSIESDTELTLESGFDGDLVSGTVLSIDGTTVTGDLDAGGDPLTDYSNELEVGDEIVDPGRGGDARRVTSISTDSFEVDSPFSASFSEAEIAQQANGVEVDLDVPDNEGLAVAVGVGQRSPQTHFSLLVFFRGSLVLQVPDASLDPESPEFVDNLVNELPGNLAYHSEGKAHQTWISATSLWNSQYTTSPESDVRPANGFGRVMATSQNRIYTVAEFDYDRAISNPLYPKPYTEYRQSLRVVNAMAPVTVEGEINSIGTIVNGSATNFTQVFKVGDYLYDPNSDQVRRVSAIVSDTELRISSPFSVDIQAGTTGIKAGYLETSLAADLRIVTSEGKFFMVGFPEPLKGGYDGDTANLLPWYFSKYLDADLNHIENAVYGKNQGLVRIATPGVSMVSIQKSGKEYATTRSFEFRCEIPITYDSAASAEAFVDQQLGRSDFMTVAAPSYGYVASPFGPGKRLVTLTGHIMGGESRFSVDALGYHVPFAGRRAILPNVLALPFSIPRDEEGIANTAGIQMIKADQGNFIVWGARLPSVSNTYQFIHVRRSQSNYNRTFIEASAFQGFLFQPNQPSLNQEVRMILENFTRREYRKGVISNHLSFDQAVEIQTGSRGNDVVTDTSTTDEIVEILNGVLRVGLKVAFTGIVERMIVETSPAILVNEYGSSLNNSVGI